jgi:hypothetical protein
MMMNGPGAAVRGDRVRGVGRRSLPGSYPRGSTQSCPGPGCAAGNLSEVCFMCAKPSLGTGKSG